MRPVVLATPVASAIDAIGWSAGRIRVGALPIEANSNARHLRS